MNDDAAAAQRRRRIVGIAAAHLVIVYDAAVALAPDLDPELVLTAAAVYLAVNRRKHKRVVASAVDSAAAFVLRSRSAHHQPVIARAVEVEIPRLELEFGLAGWHVRAVLVLRHEAEAGFAGQSGIGCISPGRRVDPAAAGHPATTRVVDHDHRRQTANGVRRARCAELIGDGELHLVYPGGGKDVGGGHRAVYLVDSSRLCEVIEHPLRGMRVAG